ncbi:contact-dependent growth inhibition system immunity protein [Erwinia sp. 198]|uniref:contact-dependent growth inhibition system immunity protein n=1 Tax=Erwinia sp. 198 TaxID=2022746 RepID=UPI001F48C688|nr:contact-dependent growth inhibition system immunity protein [Erwinia sp. 198]
MMDSNIEKTCELDNLVIIYFGQDCDIFDEECDFDNLLNEYLNTSSEFSLRMLLANLIELNAQNDRCEVLLSRYNGEFAPDRWEMTAQEWLDIVNRRLVDYMNEKGYSTELSYF